MSASWRGSFNDFQMAASLTTGVVLAAPVRNVNAWDFDPLALFRLLIEFPTDIFSSYGQYTIFGAAGRG
jgi:hypothetical protein